MEKIKKNGKKSNIPIVGLILWAIWVAVMYYLCIPALNIHSAGLWLFVIFIVLIPLGGVLILHQLIYSAKHFSWDGKRFKSTKIVAIITGTLVGLFLILMISGSAIFHASGYASILETEDYDYATDIDQTTVLNKIALMDTDSAIMLGNREIGSLADVVSQYNVSMDYMQIDYQGTPMKVSPLDYAGFFKYLGNKSEGVPGYVTVDPVGQNADYVSLDQGMKYVPSAYFSKDLCRYLRFKYPTKIFDYPHFEIDEEGHPYYVAPVIEYTISVFDGETVAGVILCDPISGETCYLDVDDIPNWVDVVFSGDLLVTQYNWKGQLSNGYWNSVFGKKGCRKTTETYQYTSEDGEEEEVYAADYGYISKDGDIWIYTGITSVNDDASNIGFILANERTSEAHIYTIAGADEASAMAAAEGEVQEKGYRASFPSLINVDDQLTYVMVLKDASGIVKLYAMVNVESYNKVTTSTDLDDCFRKYRSLIGTSTDEFEEEDENQNSGDEGENIGKETTTATITVADIQYIVMDGESYVYFTATDGNVYKFLFKQMEEVIFIKENDVISVRYEVTEDRIRNMVGLDRKADITDEGTGDATEDATESIEDSTER